MFAILLRRRLRVRPKDSIFVGPKFFDPQIAVFVKSFSSKISSPRVCENDSKKSFTFSYLINSCGLSSKEALVASEKLRIKSPEKPDEVLELLRKYGFTNAHTPRLITRWPYVLGACPKNNLLSKLEFFRSIGVPYAVLAQNLSLYPLVLQRSLKGYLIPFYDYLKSIVESDKRVVNVFLHAPRAFAHGWQREIPHNIDILRERGVPKSSIASLLAHHTALIILGKEKLTRYIYRAAEMGFDKTKTTFIRAIQVFGTMSESTLEHKMDVYRRWGWSESDINTAFLKDPFCMKYSEKRINATMDFLVNKMGVKPLVVAQRSFLLSYSVENRMKPRCLVARILNAKGLKKMLKMTSLLTISEEEFVQKYIVDYLDDIPKLLDIYRGKLSLNEMGFSEDVIEKILDFKYIDN